MMNIMIDINEDKNSKFLTISGKIEGREVYVATKDKREDEWDFIILYNTNDRKNKVFFVNLCEVMSRVHTCIDAYS